MNRNLDQHTPKHRRGESPAFTAQPVVGGVGGCGAGAANPSAAAAVVGPSSPIHLSPSSPSHGASPSSALSEGASTLEDRFYGAIITTMQSLMGRHNYGVVSKGVGRAMAVLLPQSEALGVDEHHHDRGANTLLGGGDGGGKGHHAATTHECISTTMMTMRRRVTALTGLSLYDWLGFAALLITLFVIVPLNCRGKYDDAADVPLGTTTSEANWQLYTNDLLTYYRGSLLAASTADDSGEDGAVASYAGLGHEPHERRRIQSIITFLERVVAQSEEDEQRSGSGGVVVAQAGGTNTTMPSIPRFYTPLYERLATINKRMAASQTTLQKLLASRKAIDEAVAAHNKKVAAEMERVKRADEAAAAAARAAKAAVAAAAAKKPTIRGEAMAAATAATPFDIEAYIGRFEKLAAGNDHNGEGNVGRGSDSTDTTAESPEVQHLLITSPTFRGKVKALLYDTQRSVRAITASVKAAADAAVETISTLRRERDKPFVIKWHKSAEEVTEEERQLIKQYQEDLAAVKTPSGDKQKENQRSSRSSYILTSPRFSDETAAMRYFDGLGNFAKKLLMFDGTRWVAVREFGGEEWLSKMLADGVPQV